MPNRDVYSSRPASLRDFTGGWNVADNEYNTASRFQPLSDNCVVGVDSAIGPRLGYKMYANAKGGTETTYTDQPVTFTTTNGSSKLTINWTGHPFNSGDHITINSISGTISNLSAQPSGTYGVVDTGANSFDIYLRSTASAGATSGSLNVTLVRDTHVCGGDILDMAFFQGYIVVFTDIGEIFTVGSSAVTRIWDQSISLALSGNPVGWRKNDDETPLDHVSFDTFKQSLIVVNGRTNDKPLDIDLTRGIPVQYLVDPASGSNAFVYSAEFVLSFGGYVLLVSSNNSSTSSTNTLTTVDISAKGTSGVFVGNGSPADAVQIDLGRITQTVEPRITGVASIRDKVVITFIDSAMLGTLGVYNGSVHDPQFTDQVPQHGAINHRVIANIGNDLLMCDYAGVPAFTQSLMSGAIAPERISQLIDPELNRHLSRLSSETLQYKPFALFNTRDRQYMLFVPKYDSSSAFYAADNSIYVTSDLAPSRQVLVYAPSHTVNLGDYVDISGATSITGLAAGDLNGRRLVSGIIDANYFVITLDVVPSAVNVNGGGSAALFEPVNDETIAYVFTLNAPLRIKRWTRFRDLNFKAGVLSRDGRVYFASDSRIYQFGTSDIPFYGDAIADWNLYGFSTSYAYVEGDKVYDTANATVYECLVSHTSINIGSFADERSTYATYWEIHRGTPINWVFETPWSDLGDRQAVKRNTNIQIDATGSAQFTVKAFVDGIYRSEATFALQPTTTMAFIGKDGGGFGAGYYPYGGGRRTKEQFAYTFPFRGKIVKMRVEGSSIEPLKITGIFFLYQKGSVIR